MNSHLDRNRTGTGLKRDSVEKEVRLDNIAQKARILLEGTTLKENRKMIVHVERI